eukprot:3967283-Ditylum_brightwellii.AAC.1
MKDGNAVLLNKSTDGISCETQYSKNLILAYHCGNKIYLSFPDANHNIKNCRGQMVSSMSASSISYFVVDPWMLKIAGVLKELYCIEAWASDLIVLQLASPKT